MSVSARVVNALQHDGPAMCRENPSLTAHALADQIGLHGATSSAIPGSLKASSKFGHISRDLEGVG